jgi:HK97 family phage major capsid protein
MKLVSKLKFGLIAAAIIGLLAAVFGLIDTHAASFAMAATAPVALSEDEVKEFKSVLGDMKGGWAEIKKLPELLKGVQQENEKLKGDLDTLRKIQLNLRTAQRIARPGQVSEDCARHIGAIVILAANNQEKLSHLSGSVRESLLGKSREILGITEKSALTTSDIPLPTEFGGEVVELVSAYGAARKYGTVMPLGTGTVKLPKLTTDTAFGLIASSGTVTEVSPAFAFVTFTAEKFGGLIRLPTELEEDSIVAVGQFVGRYAARQIAKSEDHNFFVGSGAATGVNGTVKGLTYSTIDNSKVTQMASTKTHYSDATLANLRTLRTNVDAAALGTSAYYMHPSFEQLLSALNASGDKPYNPQAQIMGSTANPITTGPTLDGFPIRWVDIMPAYSTSVNASKVFILFGDVSFQYLGVRGGIRFDTSREAGFTTDEILIRALERFTIGLMATGAVGGLETAAS